MKLRSKLILLVAGAAAFFLLSVATYFALLAPLEGMEREIGTFQELSRATANLEVEANLLLINTLGAQKENYDQAVKRFHDAQNGMKTVAPG